MQKNIYITAGVLVSVIVAALAALNAGSTTYKIDSPRSDLGNEDSVTLNPIATHEVNTPAQPKEQTISVAASSSSVTSARPTTTPEKTDVASASSVASVQQKSYTIHVENSGTVLSVMEEFAKTSRFEFKTKDFPGLGVLIEEINGLKNADGYYWILYINGKTSDTGASAAEVSQSDSIEWKYEKGY